MHAALEVPLSACADRVLRSLARATGSAALAGVDGRTVLCERAALGGMSIPRRTSAGGGCRLFDAIGDTIALNLARAADHELLPALFETDSADLNDLETVGRLVSSRVAEDLVSRGRTLGLAIAGEHESAPPPAVGCTELATGLPKVNPPRAAPRVLDLTALWAGPLAGHLLWLGGAEVVKVESRTRPDAMRSGDEKFYALLNQGKALVSLDLTDHNDRQALLSLVAGADIVIEAARPRALVQLGIDATRLVQTTPGLVWITITGHGAEAEAANWVGFGDDCGVRAGLSAAFRRACGHTGFVGDAIADPLTGIFAAHAAWEAWRSCRGGRFGLALSSVVASCMAQAMEQDARGFEASLRAWGAAAGQPFPTISQRTIGAPGLLARPQWHR
jgi:CoA-transferase family III